MKDRLVETTEDDRGRPQSCAGLARVLYLGVTREAALVETLLRNPRRRLLAARRIAERASSGNVVLRPLTLVALMDEGLQRLGLNNSISTGPYGPCGWWSDALYDHPEVPDGLAYRSRVALFERPDVRVAPKGEPMRLAGDQRGSRRSSTGTHAGSIRATESS